MELQKTKHEIRLERWRELVQECRSSGMTVKTWCSQRQISEKTYYRWQKEVWKTGVEKAALAKVVTFAEYTPPVRESGGSALVVHLSCGSVEVQNGAEAAVIEHTLQALQKLC